jgi:hypothetical protein
MLSCCILLLTGLCLARGWLAFGGGGGGVEEEEEEEEVLRRIHTSIFPFHFFFI